MFDIFTKEGLISFLYLLPALLISLAIHEFAHAYTAYKLGDRSQKALGRLTLDPFAHMDWMGFLAVALLGFGWGKPVMVNDSSFKNKARDNMLVALAGPMSNLIMAVIFTLIFKLLMITGIITDTQTFVNSVVISMLALAIQFNVIFAIFNMIPIPPFDGSKVLHYFLPRKGKEVMDMLEVYSFYIIIIFLVTGLGSMIVKPIVGFVLGLLNMII